MFFKSKRFFCKKTLDPLCNLNKINTNNTIILILSSQHNAVSKCNSNAKNLLLFALLLKNFRRKTKENIFKLVFIS